MYRSISIGTPCTTVYIFELLVQQYIYWNSLYNTTYWSSLYNSIYIGTLCTIFIGTPCRTVYIGNPCTVVYLLQLPVQHHFNIFIGTPLHVNSVHCTPLNSVVLLYKSCDPWNISQHFCERIDLIKFYWKISTFLFFCFPLAEWIPRLKTNVIWWFENLNPPQHVVLYFEGFHIEKFRILVLYFVIFRFINPFTFPFLPPPFPFYLLIHFPNKQTGWPIKDKYSKWTV